MILKKLFRITLFLSITILSISCIGDDYIDDYVDPEIRIFNAIDTIGINTSHQFEATYFNEVGGQVADAITWSSSAPEIISIQAGGLAEGLQLGSSTLTAHVSSDLSKSFDVVVGGMTTEISSGTKRTGEIKTTSSYVLEGHFELEEANDIVTLNIFEDYKATSALPGLAAYLSNNPNSVSGAYEIGELSIFEGEHSFTLTEAVGLNDYKYLIYFCKPFNVKVGEGEIGEPE